jgi:hypothetical protein
MVEADVCSLVPVLFVPSGCCLSRSEGSIRWQRNRDLELMADLHSVFKFLDFPQAPPLDETRPC